MRPRSAVADQTELRSVGPVGRREDLSVLLRVLADPAQILQERILREQFTT